MRRGAVTLWLLVVVAVSGLYYTPSGEELLIMSTESASAGWRLWLAQLLLAVVFFLYLTDFDRRPHGLGLRALAATFAVLPSLLLANAFIVTALQFVSPDRRAVLYENAYFYAFFSAASIVCFAHFIRVPAVGRRRAMRALLGSLALFLAIALWPSRFGSLLGPNLAVALGAFSVIGLEATLHYGRTRLRTSTGP